MKSRRLYAIPEDFEIGEELSNNTRIQVGILQLLTVYVLFLLCVAIINLTSQINT